MLTKLSSLHARGLSYSQIEAWQACCFRLQVYIHIQTAKGALMVRFRSILGFLIILLFGVQAPATYGQQSNNLVYEIFVRSFADSDGNSVGDIKGIIQRLDTYLNDGNPGTDNDLEVGILWLMPIFPAGSYHGYDVTDYRAINPDYGTLNDFKRLLQEAHSRGVRVILDVPFNHTSNQHPWFKEAINN